MGGKEHVCSRFALWHRPGLGFQTPFPQKPAGGTRNSKFYVPSVLGLWGSAPCGDGPWQLPASSRKHRTVCKALSFT